MEQYNYKVRVSCLTFNHAPYVVDTLNGFCLQQTSFPYICTIFDDCSTDGEQEVIRQYLQDHFDLEDKSVVRNEETDDYLLTFARHKTNENCFFAVYYLKYNHYSIGKGYRKQEYCKEFTDEVHYIALCEGDDYWIDPLKLQRQVDYLETHLGCTMICNRTKRYSEKYHSFLDDCICAKKDAILNAKDIIRKGGLYISTCSMVYRKEIKERYPRYCLQCHVGDYPLQIMAAMKGGVYYFNNPMSVYRVNNPTSWVGRTASKSIKVSYLKGTRTEVDMLKGFAEEYANYRSCFIQRIGFYITSILYNYRNDLHSLGLIKDEYKDEINNFSLLWKLRMFFIFHYLYGLRKLHTLLYNRYVKPKFE